MGQPHRKDEERSPQRLPGLKGRAEPTGHSSVRQPGYGGERLLFPRRRPEPQRASVKRNVLHGFVQRWIRASARKRETVSKASCLNLQPPRANKPPLATQLRSGWYSVRRVVAGGPVIEMTAGVHSSSPLFAKNDDAHDDKEGRGLKASRGTPRMSKSPRGEDI